MANGIRFVEDDGAHNARLLADPLAGGRDDAGDDAGDEDDALDDALDHDDDEIVAGATLGGFRVERLIGVGGFCRVYAAVDLALRRPVALKVMSATRAQNLRLRQRFVTEAQLLARLHHDGIVGIYGFGIDDGRPFCALELLQGESLREVLRRRGALPLAEVVELLAPLADALAHAHRAGVVHRDVKPSNLILVDGATGPRLKLVDFGIAKDIESPAALTREGIALGTPAYMAPEQVCGSDVDARADVYALGLVAFEMLTGARAFAHSEPAALMHDHLHTPLPSAHALVSSLPRDVDAVLARLTAKDAALRPRTAPAAVALLAHALDDAPLADRDDATAPQRSRARAPAPGALVRAPRAHLATRTASSATSTSTAASTTAATRSAAAPLSPPRARGAAGALALAATLAVLSLASLAWPRPDTVQPPSWAAGAAPAPPAFAAHAGPPHRAPRFDEHRRGDDGPPARRDLPRPGH